MECNKEEALRAKGLAEKKFQERDFAGARRFVTKAIRLNSSLEGLSQMLPVIDVHIVSKQTVGDGEMDWYGILQIEPVASEASIKSQYKKLALLFHPDKNKAMGAESAFKLISDAWNVLSDKSTKLQHDSKRRSYGGSSVRTSYQVDRNRRNRQNFQSKPDTRNEERAMWEALERLKAEEERQREAERKLQMEEEMRKESEMKKKNEEKEKKKRRRRRRRERVQTVTKERVKMTRRKSQELNAGRERNKMPRFKILGETPLPSESDLGDQLEENSKQIFRASELSQLHQLKRRMVQREARETRAHRRQSAVRVVDEDSRHQQVQEVYSRGQQVQGDGQAQQVSTGLDVGQAGKRKNKLNEIGGPKEEEGYGGKRRKVENPTTTGLRGRKFETNKEENQRPVLTSREILNPESIFVECSHDRLDVHAVKKTLYVSGHLPAVIPDEAAKLEEERSFDGQTGRLRGSDHELPQVAQDSEHEEMLLNGPHGYTRPWPNPTNEDEKSRLRAEVLVNDSKIKVNEAAVDVSIRATRRMLREKGKQVSVELEVEGNVPHHDHAQVVPKRSYPGGAGLQHLDGRLLEVFPSQFCAFDDIRTRQAFQAGQIWAVYDDTDGMPRFYCRLTRVSRSPSPFTARLSWLEPTSNTERRHRHFWAEGYSVAVACGEFEAGEDAVAEYINIFSHCVSENLKEDPVKIYPRKAETWAIYVDWNQKRKGKQLHEAAAEGEDMSKQSYELVGIVEDYSEDHGVATVRLVQAPGFRSVFHRQQGPGAVQCFSPSQLPAFSHRILSGKVAGDVKLGLPGDFWELDPASLPESVILCSTP